MLPVVRVDFKITDILVSVNLRRMIYQRFVCILVVILGQYKTSMRSMMETQLKTSECG